MAHEVAGSYTGTLASADGIVTIANVEIGTGTDRGIAIWFRRRTDRFPAVESVTIGGEAMTVFGTDTTVPGDTNFGWRGAYLKIPTATGLQSLVIDCTTTAAGTSACDVVVQVVDGITSGWTATAVTPTTGTDNTSELTVSSATGRQIAFGFTISTGDVGLDTATPSNCTITAENGNPRIGGGLGYAAAYASGAASVAAVVTWLDTPDAPTPVNGWVAEAIDWTPPAASTAVTGTLSDGATEAEIRAGGQTAILTLTGDTWVASGATFNAQRSAIIQGFDSASAGANGWNAEIRDKEVVGAVVRTSDTVVTVTFTANTAYNISANETITVTVPGAALTGTNPITATPTFTITSGSDSDIATTSDAGIRTGNGFTTFVLKRIIRRYAG